MLLSLIKRCVPPQIAQKHMLLEIAQKRTNFKSNVALMSTAARSLNTIKGKVTLKLNLFATVTKCSSNIPICLKNQPITITRKIGNVTFKLNINSLILFHFLIFVEVKLQIKICLLFTIHSYLPLVHFI